MSSARRPPPAACAGAAWGKARPATRLLGATTALRARLGTAALVAADVAAEGEARTLVCRALGAAQVAALEAAAHRHSFSQLEDDLQEILAGEVTPIAAARADRVLTPRERDVLARLVTRRTNREIAAALFLSPATVAWHIGAILDKLDVASRHEAAARAVADGWLEQPW